MGGAPFPFVGSPRLVTAKGQWRTFLILDLTWSRRRGRAYRTFAALASSSKTFVVLAGPLVGHAGSEWRACQSKTV